MTRQRFLRWAERIELALFGALLVALLANIVSALLIWRAMP